MHQAPLTPRHRQLRVHRPQVLPCQFWVNGHADSKGSNWAVCAREAGSKGRRLHLRQDTSSIPPSPTRPRMPSSPGQRTSSEHRGRGGEGGMHRSEQASRVPSSGISALIHDMPVLPQLLHLGGGNNLQRDHILRLNNRSIPVHHGAFHLVVEAELQVHGFARSQMDRRLRTGRKRPQSTCRLHGYHVIAGSDLE